MGGSFHGFLYVYQRVMALPEGTWWVECGVPGNDVSHFGEKKVGS